MRHRCGDLVIERYKASSGCGRAFIFAFLAMFGDPSLRMH